jgi:hypothetical protein
LQTDDDDDQQQPSPTRKLLKKTNGTTDLAKVHSSFGPKKQTVRTP